MTITEIEGFADLGMFQEAWETLEELPPDVRASSLALRIRLRCCPPIGAWGIGEQVANFLREGDRLDKACAAGFYHANARRLIELGDQQGALENVNAAVATFPECRFLIREEPHLEALL